MPSKLLIVESPGKIKKLSQILGSDWLVKASVGHIRELASDGDDSLGFDLDSHSGLCRTVLDREHVILYRKNNEAWFYVVLANEFSVLLNSLARE